MRLIILAVVLASPWAAAADSESKWMQDGWRAGFGPGLCFLAQVYHDQDIPIIGTTNVRFLKIIDLKMTYPDTDYPPLAFALLDAGVERMELVLSATLPDKTSFVAPPVLAQNVSVGGFPAEKIMLVSHKYEDEWTEFLIREPHSKTLLARITDGEAILFDVAGGDGNNVEFVYNEKLDINFRIRHAQFDACVRTMSGKPDL